MHAEKQVRIRYIGADGTGQELVYDGDVEVGIVLDALGIQRGVFTDTSSGISHCSYLTRKST